MVAATMDVLVNGQFTEAKCESLFLGQKSITKGGPRRKRISYKGGGKNGKTSYEAKGTRSAASERQ